MAGPKRRTREPRGRSVGVNLAPACPASRQKREASIVAGCSGCDGLLGCLARTGKVLDQSSWLMVQNGLAASRSQALQTLENALRLCAAGPVQETA